MAGFGPQIFASEQERKAELTARAAAISEAIGGFDPKHMHQYAWFQEAARYAPVVKSNQVMDAKLLNKLLKEVDPQAPGIDPKDVAQIAKGAQEVNNTIVGGKNGKEAMAEQIAGLLQDPEKVPPELAPYVNQVKEQLKTRGKERPAIADPAKFNTDELKKIMGKMVSDGQFGASSRLAEQIARQHSFGLANDDKRPVRVIGSWPHSLQKAGVQLPEGDIFKDGIIHKSALPAAQAHLEKVQGQAQKPAPAAAPPAAGLEPKRVEPDVGVTPPPRAQASPPLRTPPVAAAPEPPKRGGPMIIQRSPPPARQASPPRPEAEPDFKGDIGAAMRWRREHGQPALPSGRADPAKPAESLPPKAPVTRRVPAPYDAARV